MKLEDICCACLSFERKLSPLNYTVDGVNNLFSLLSHNSEPQQVAMNKEVIVPVQTQEGLTTAVSCEGKNTKKPDPDATIASTVTSCLSDHSGDVFKVNNLELENLPLNSSGSNVDLNINFDTEESTNTLVKKEELKLKSSFESIKHQDLNADESVKSLMEVKIQLTSTHQIKSSVSGDSIKNLDFDEEESVNNNIKQEELSTSNDCNFSGVKSLVDRVNQDFDKAASSNTLKIPPQPSNSTHLKTKRKKRIRWNKPKVITNKEARNLAVVIKRADGVFVTKELALIIHERIIKHILEAGRNNVASDKLHFYNSGLVDAGYYLVTAMNEQSRDWLMSRHLGFYEGVPIKMYRRRKPRKKVPKSSHSGNATKSQHFHKENSTTANAFVKEEELLLKPSTSGKSLIIKDFETKESTHALIQEQELVAASSNSDKG